MRRSAHLAFFLALVPATLLPSRVSAQKAPLLPEKDVAALAQELSGETAKRNLEGVVRFHRQRGSQGFHSAAELVAERARAYGLSDVAILAFPADGKIFYGTQRSRPAWDAEVGDLTEIGVCDKEKIENGKLEFNTKCEKFALPKVLKIASYEEQPIVLAEDSESSDVAADLVDVGDGTKDSDYAGKAVKGKIVLAGAQPGAIQDLAVGKFGAAGIISYAQNQKTAWWGEDENLIRWGHLETFSPNKTFGFMVSLKTARALRDRMSKGERVTLHAVVKAGQHPGNLEVVTATIPGADPKLKDEEIAFSCHLDHQRPGANDNASGCTAILEVARTLQKLIANGQLARPARTIRFIWPPEIEGTLTLLNAKPEFAKRIKAVVHMDMVGGGPATKSVFHVTRGPLSLPSFIHAVAWAFAQFVNEQSLQFASTGSAEFPLVATEGGKEPLLAQDAPYTMGSDHDVYQDSSFGIPAIYFNDWPDRYIHTNFDSAANIDPTKLKRAAFIGAASGYFLATLTAQDPRGYSALQPVLSDDRNQQTAASFHRYAQLDRAERESAMALNVRTLRQTYASASSFLPGTAAMEAEFGLLARTPDRTAGTIEAPALAGDALVKFARKATPRGPVTVFGYDFVNDHSGKVTRPKLLDYEGLWGAGEEYAYETLNFANGYRTGADIRDEVSAEYGPVPLELILEYLQTLEKIAVVERNK